MAGDCLECESTYYVEYEEELTSKEVPHYCPFCGAPTDDVTEEDMDEEEDYDDEDEESEDEDE